ncbi:ImmA/IrrE family metallo-endopeptidase [Hyphomonas sp.]|uniref:ImmA/IrrE family metallo-endopeptidase n=1 Tax=Hyphomonas sp. TaxID=87 RepID=UPI0030FAE8C4
MTAEFRPPEATNLSKDSVFRIAENVAKQVAYKPDCDLHPLIEELGGDVHLKDFWSEGSRESGSLEVRARNDFSIFVPVDTSELRDRFTIAHELGHYVLHYLWQIQVKKKPEFRLRASRYGSDRAEWEANWFASAFLMPSSEFKTLAAKHSTGHISRHFKVSRQAVEIRAKTLCVDVES